MQTGCIHCGQQHLLNDEVLAQHSKVQFRCTKCGKTTIVEVKRRVDETMAISPMPSFARADATTARQGLPPSEEGLSLPEDVDVILTVTSGPDKGLTQVLTRPRVVVGRKGAGFALNDPEISRHHCALEFRERSVNLKDLDSTNGTFFEGERVRAAFLQHGAEFRVGSSVVRLTFESKTIDT
jgi:predicted RNA-binding Zn-ribbon protein involved in translation (DUF1610 family)